MIRRVKAFKTIFNFLLTMVELLIGLCFLINTFGSRGTISELSETIGQTLEQIGYAASYIINISDISGSVSALVMILSFMIFSFILITIVPRLTEKIEEDIEVEPD